MALSAFVIQTHLPHTVVYIIYMVMTSELKCGVNWNGCFSRYPICSQHRKKGVSTMTPTLSRLPAKEFGLWSTIISTCWMQALRWCVNFYWPIKQLYTSDSCAELLYLAVNTSLTFHSKSLTVRDQSSKIKCIKMFFASLEGKLNAFVPLSTPQLFRLLKLSEVYKPSTFMVILVYCTLSSLLICIWVLICLSHD